MHTVTKQYRDFPAAHRQPNHDGHCRLIHGHNWGWDIVFSCDELDKNGFVIDVGNLKEVKAFLTNYFDHTLLLNGDDPEYTNLAHHLGHLAKIVLVPNCGMEGLAKFVFEKVQGLIDSDAFAEAFGRNLRVVKVTCWEDSKNSSTYRPPVVEPF